MTAIGVGDYACLLLLASYLPADFDVELPTRLQRVSGVGGALLGLLSGALDVLRDLVRRRAAEDHGHGLDWNGRSDVERHAGLRSGLARNCQRIALVRGFREAKLRLSRQLVLALVRGLVP